MDSLSLEMRPGEILGFLGPNGAGKTTTIRMVLGLIRPTSGTIEVLGERVGPNHAPSLRRVGALVETPALYLFMSATDNLSALTAGRGVSRQQIDRALATVGLSTRSREKVGNYSLGMKQRLALAVALICDPELLILDEPANGLDPAGIAEVRGLLKGISAEGRSILMSSHVLAEVDQLCDRVAIVSKGRLVKLASMTELLAEADTFLVQTDATDRTLSALKSCSWGKGAVLEDGLIVTPSPTGKGKDLIRFLAQADLFPDSVTPRRQQLEEVFLRLTAGTEEAATTQAAVPPSPGSRRPGDGKDD